MRGGQKLPSNLVPAGAGDPEAVQQPIQAEKNENDF